MIAPMTYPRSLLVPPGSPGTFHCVSRCVRRAFLCGADSYTGRSFEHRRGWVEGRLHELADVFAVAIWGYAVMSNHLHVVVQTLPEAVQSWSDEEIAGRWMRLFSRQDVDDQIRAQVLAGNADRIAVLRGRLSDLSWFMRCLSEPIARRANREDVCKGRFWEGRFKCQVLLDEPSVLAAMAYVDLNPIRAKVCDSLDESHYTSAKQRIKEISDKCSAADCPLAPISGLRGFGVMSMTQADYLVLVDFTGRQVRPVKRGAVTGPPPAALRALGYGSEQWTRQVMAVGSSFNRAVGQVESMVEKAVEIGQFWLRGISLARVLARRTAGNT